MKVLVTGVTGFIGSALLQGLTGHELVGLDHARADITDETAVRRLCREHVPDAVIHCAAIAHQKVGAVAREDYLAVNVRATETLARAAAEANPEVRFVFLSSVSVYGEQAGSGAFSEDSSCRPSGPYAESKLDAERRLIALHDAGILKHLDILRLAPVYDREWSLNLDRRVLAPRGLAYLRFGDGSQRMSALARPNLAAFVRHLLGREAPDGVRIFNVCDEAPYSFADIINVFRKSGVQPDRPVVSVPLVPVWLGTRLAGTILRENRDWWYACYDKLAGDLVYDNSRMLATGFSPQESLETIFNPR